MQWTSKRHKGVYFAGGAMIFFGLMGLAAVAAAAANPSSSASIDIPEGAMPAVLIVSLMMVGIGFLIRWSVRRPMPDG